MAGALVGLTMAQGGRWGLLVCPSRYGCPSLLFWLSLLLILASTLSLQLGRVAQQVAGSDAPLSLSHWELSPSPPASPLPIYKHHGPWLLGAVALKASCLRPCAWSLWLSDLLLALSKEAWPWQRAGDPARGCRSSPLAWCSSRSGLNGDVLHVAWAGYCWGRSVWWGERGCG